MRFYHIRDDYITLDAGLTAYDRRVKARCCDLALLEAVYRDYDK